MGKIKFNLKAFLLGKISRKLYIGFFGFILIIIGLGYIAFIQVSQISEPLNKDFPENIEIIKKNSNLDGLAQFIRYYDEVLTQSARNYAFTADIKWKNRYLSVVPELDRIIQESIEKGDEKDTFFFSSIDESNIALVEMEEKSISLVDQGKLKEAVEILESEEYSKQKKIYQEGLKNYVSRRGYQYSESLEVSTQMLALTTEKVKNSIKRNLSTILILILLSFILSISLSFLISRSISKPIQQLSKATEELKKGNFKVKVNIQTGDELEDLGNMFNKTIQSLGSLEDEYKELEKAKTEFLSITSHELRSPMTPMKAQLQMILQGYFGKLNVTQRKSLDIVLRNTQRLDKIIVDFLEISRIEAARLKFRFVKEPLLPYIQRLVSEMDNFLPKKNIKIITKIGKLPLIELDPDRIMQVLRNLIHNAKKFSPKDSNILVEVKQENKMIKFSVKDQGIGIPLKKQQIIFEPFFQAEETMYRKYGGTGLGLAICKGIVESQNGKIVLESKLGKGSTFYFTFPLNPIKKIKPIKLLFSTKESVENKINEIFKELLGPIGPKEFEDLKKKNGPLKENLFKYIDILNKQKIIDKEKYNMFKDKTRSVFGEEKRVRNEL